MIYILGQNKGGVGKTTIAMNFAIELQRRGRRPAVVDADHTLRTAQIWADDRVSAGLPPIPAFTGEGNLMTTLENLHDSHDDVILDARGGDSQEMRTGLVASDLLIVPTSGQQNDLDSLEPLDATVKQAKDFNPDLTVLVVLNRVSPQGSRYEIADAKAYLEDFPQFQLAETVLTTAKAWSRARTEGKGIVEIPGKPKAAMQLLATEFITAAGEKAPHVS